MGVVRNYNLASNLLQFFPKVRVITTSNRSILPKDELPIKKEIELFSIKTFDYRSISALKKNRQQVHYKEETKENSLVRFLIKLIDSCPFNFILGEGGLVYLIGGIFKGIQLIRKEKPVFIYSSFRPFTDHVIAYCLKLLFPKIKWVADYRDLHVDPIYKNVLWPSFQHWCNKKILKKASLVTTVSEGLAKQLSRYHHKVHVLRNGVDIVPNIETPYEKFTISYTGSLFKDERRPELFLAALQSLLIDGSIKSEDIVFQYAGKDSPKMRNWIEKYDLMPVFKDRALVKRNEAILIQRKSQLNLLLSSSSPELKGVLTGKFFEYMTTGIPILLIINGTRDEEFEGIFKRYNLGAIFYNEDKYLESAKSFILNAYRSWTAQEVNVSKVKLNDIKRDFSWTETIKKMSKQIDI